MKLVKYLGVGLFQFLLDIALFFVLQKIGIYLAVANTISRLTAAMAGFYLNKNFTFSMSKSKFKLMMVRYWIFWILMTILSSVLIIGLKTKFDEIFPIAIVKFAAEAILCLLSFYISKNWIYKMLNKKIIGVIIPCFKVAKHIQGVIASIGAEVDFIYVVDDACPEGSGKLVEQSVIDPRVSVVYCSQNLGVGGAVMTGYRAALKDNCDCMVKIDGDGQMSPALLPLFVEPIIEGRADYTKGNRFFNLEDVESMPLVRLIGNAALSFMCKASSGYWSIFDPTNGYTAISRNAASLLPMNKIDNRYFFETDMLFRLGTFDAVVQDIPMRAIYADEKSNLSIKKVLIYFSIGHARNFFKRIFYNYFLRGFSVASIELILSLLFLSFGGIYGVVRWVQSSLHGIPATSGEVMLAALPVIVGVQLLISFIGFDMQNQPKTPLKGGK